MAHADIALHHSIGSETLRYDVKGKLIQAGFSVATQPRTVVVRPSADREWSLVIMKSEPEAMSVASMARSQTLLIDEIDGSATLVRLSQYPLYIRLVSTPADAVWIYEAENLETTRAHLLGSKDYYLHPLSDPIATLVCTILNGLLSRLIEPSRAIIKGSRLYYNELLLRISKDVRELHAISPRQFEELVAEMLSRDGFNVTLTKNTRDGGIDIFAEKLERFGSVVYGYECKKYRPNRPISVSIVREFATAIRESGCKLGVLCTTSSFTNDALNTAKAQLIYPQNIEAMSAWVNDLVIK